MERNNTRANKDDTSLAEVTLKKRGYISPTVTIWVPMQVENEDMQCGGRTALTATIAEMRHHPNSKQVAEDLRSKCAQCAVKQVCLLGRTAR